MSVTNFTRLGLTQRGAETSLRDTAHGVEVNQPHLKEQIHAHKKRNDANRGDLLHQLARPPHYLESRNDALVQTIREFVAIESPSDNKLAADAMGAHLAARFEALGGRAR